MSLLGKADLRPGRASHPLASCLDDGGHGLGYRQNRHSRLQDTGRRVLVDWDWDCESKEASLAARLRNFLGTLWAKAWLPDPGQPI